MKPLRSPRSIEDIAADADHLPLMVVLNALANVDISEFQGGIYYWPNAPADLGNFCVALGLCLARSWDEHDALVWKYRSVENWNKMIDLEWNRPTATFVMTMKYDEWPMVNLTVTWSTDLEHKSWRFPITELPTKMFEIRNWAEIERGA